MLRVEFEPTPFLSYQTYLVKNTELLKGRPFELEIPFPIRVALFCFRGAGTRPGRLLD